MKKWLGVITLSAFLLAIGSACTTKESTHSSGGFALSKTFSSTEEITQDAMVILKGSVPQAYKEEKSEFLLYYVYEVAVDDVFQNLTDHQIKAGDTIKLYRIVGFQPDKDKEIAPIADHKQTEIPEGEYLLFLNGGYDEEVGHVRWFPNTPNQLFKATGGDSSTEYKNVFVSDEIPSITEEDVLNAI